MKDTMGRENRKLADRACANFGTMFKPARDSARYCSRPCMWANNGGRRRQERGETA